MKLGKTYQKAEIDDFYFKNHKGHSTWSFGFTHEKENFIRFAEYEFWRTDKEKELYVCHKSPEGSLDPEKEKFFGTAIKLPTNTRSKAYYTRYDKKSIEGRKYGYKPNG